MRQTLTEQLAEIVGPKYVSCLGKDLKEHAIDKSFHAASTPGVVVWPSSASEISQILKLANAKKITVVSYGSGTSLEGNAIPGKGGIVLNMRRMNKIIEISAADHQVVTEPGIIGDELNAQLAKQKLFFPAVPGSSHIATIGGMVANNAGGMHAVKYGVVGDWVLQLEVVLPSGEIIQTGSRAFKSVAGYDLKRLFIGSEGTLGVITKITLRLTKLPAKRAALLASFSSVKSAAEAVLEIMNSDIEPAALEFMEKNYVALINQAKPLNWQEKPSLIVELHGAPASIELGIARLKEIFRNYTSNSLEIAITDKDRLKIWGGRKAARQNISKILPCCGVIPGDIGLPLSKIPAFIKKVKQIGAEQNVKTFTFGHAGDGNLHIWQVYKIGNEESFARARQVSEKLVMHALKLGGTCTAEHGIGIGKRKYLATEHASSLSLMKQIKNLFDPNKILNPNKLFLEEKGDK